MIARSIVAALLLAVSQPAARGFAAHDLTRVRFDPVAVLGAGYATRVTADRMTMQCASCDGAPMLDVRLGRQDDGTEGRVRAGTTTIADLEAVCQARDPACRMAMVAVAPAVGWMSSYRIGAQSAHTVIVLRGGDLLSIRSLADDDAVARRNAAALLKKLVPGVVGR